MIKTLKLYENPLPKNNLNLVEIGICNHLIFFTFFLSDMSISLICRTSSSSSSYYSRRSARVQELKHEQNLPYNLSKLVGSSNGVLCFLYDDDDDDSKLLLWNPLFFQKNNTMHISPPPFSTCVKAPLSYGFGYDEIADDYKVVCLNIGRASNNCCAAIFSLKSNKWNIITIRNFEHDPPRGRAVFIVGAFHWVNEDSTTIIAFDLVSEKFREILWPSYDYPPDHEGGVTSIQNLGILDDCLWMTTCHDGGKCRSSHDVWLMKSCGVEDSWTRINLNLYASGNTYICLTPMAYEKGKTIVLRGVAQGRDLILFYDSTKQCVVNVVHLNHSFSEVYTYVETPELLESLQGEKGNQVEKLQGWMEGIHL